MLRAFPVNRLMGVLVGGKWKWGGRVYSDVLKYIGSNGI